MPDRNAICDYCRMPQLYDLLPFQIDHVIAKKHRGGNELQNLAIACLHCNSHKGPNIAGIDPQTRRITRLFHPRKEKWESHFRWKGAQLVGLTAVGRATIAVLEMNHHERVAIRASLLKGGFFPPRIK
jgi:hypothetical protein